MLRLEQREARSRASEIASRVPGKVSRVPEPRLASVVPSPVDFLAVVFLARLSAVVLAPLLVALVALSTAS